MTVGRSEAAINITVNNKGIKQVSDSKYLERTFPSDGRMDKEMDVRCNKAIKCWSKYYPFYNTLRCH